MDHLNTDRIVDENSLPVPLKTKNGAHGTRRQALCPIVVAGQENVRKGLGNKNSKPEFGSKSNASGDPARDLENKVCQTKPTSKAGAKNENPNPAVIVKSINGSTTIATALTPAVDFSIYCDESSDSLGDSPQEGALDLSIAKVESDRSESRHDSVYDVFEAVGMQDRALKELKLDTSLLLNSSDDVFETPHSMRTAGKSAMNKSALDMSVDVENIEPVCKKSKQSLVKPIDCLQDYDMDIFKYLLKAEKEHAIDPDYMELQKDINPKMRVILIDWMVEVADEYRLEDETLFLAVNFVDRFLSKMTIARQSFQLLGTSSLFIASKYEEIYPPDVNEFVYITDDSYDKSQVLKMETLILKTLNMNISSPTSHYFLRRLISMTRAEPQISALSEYLCYLSMMFGGDLLHFYPSEVAFSCLILAAHTLGEEEQLAPEILTETLQLMTDSMLDNNKITKKEDLKQRLNDCLSCLLSTQKSAPSLVQKAIITKYSQPKYFGISSTDCLEAPPEIE